MEDQDDLILPAYRRSLCNVYINILNSICNYRPIIINVQCESLVLRKLSFGITSIYINAVD